MTSVPPGIYNIMATPFTPDGGIDQASLRRLIAFQLDKGAHGLTILGVLGEAATLSVDERRLVMDCVMQEVAGRAPVVVGVSHPEPDTVIALSRAAFAAGCAGVMIAPPPNPAPSDDWIYSVYAAVADATDGAIVVQDFPPVNGVILSPEVLARIAEGIPSARSLKLEDPPLMQKISAVRARTERYTIFGGLGGMFLLEELERGASGTMTGFAFTEILAAVYQAHRAGDAGRAASIFDRYLPLIRFENQPVINLPIRKELLRRRGAIAHATLRARIPPLDAGTLREIDRIFARVGITDPTQRLQLDALAAAAASSEP
jgi:4-hydroxy-tetrahydrodipicolinate synthase